MQFLECIVILILAGIVASLSTCPSEGFADERMEATESVQASVRDVFSRLLNDTVIANDSLSTMELYERIASEAGVIVSPSGLVRFQEAINEITAARFDACSTSGHLTVTVADIPKLTASFATLVDAGNISQAREVYGKLLCLHDQLSATTDKARAKRQVDPFVLLEAFFDSLDGDRVATIFGIDITTGAAPTLAFVVDDTGSMRAEISSVQRVIRSFIKTERSEPLAYILTTFNDPGVGIPRKYAANNLAQLTALDQAVNALSASGGGDCPELGMTGILNALSLAIPDSNVIVLTDAPPKDEFRKAEVITKATELRNSIHFFLSHGCGDFTPYLDVADATFGIVVNRIDDFEAFAEFAEEAGRFSFDPLDSGVIGRRRRQEVPEEYCINFSASIFTTSINVLFASVTDPITVTTPSDVANMLSSSGSIVTYKNDDPESGQYRACSKSVFRHAISMSSTLDFFVEYFGNNYRIAVPGRLGLVIVSTFQLDKLLVHDSSRPVVLKFVSEDDVVLSTTQLILCSEFFTGESINPKVPFYPVLEGYDHDGNEFSQRGSLTRIPEPDCPCLNGGSCLTIVRFGRPRIICRCASGYTGSLCQYSLS